MTAIPESRLYNPADSVTQADLSVVESDPIQTVPTENYIDNPGDARYFGVFVGFLVVFLGVAGNGVTVWAYLRNKNLQTSFNVLIANLCLVDLIFSVVVISFILPGYIVGSNIYSDFMCSMIGYLYYVSLTSSLYNLVAIAVNRYVGIVKSKHYQKLFTGRRLAVCIASVWLVPAILYLPLVTGGAIKWTGNTLRCAIGRDIPPSIKWYNLALDVSFQAVPLVVLIILYTAIFKKVKQVKRKMKGHQKTTKSKVGRMSSASGSMKFKSGNTSDDTGDEFKPSSLLEGLSLKPIQTSIDQNLNHESSEILSKHGDETEDDEKSTDDPLTPSIDDSLNNVLNDFSQPKKRSSIWTMLWRNNPKSNGSQSQSQCNSKPEHNLQQVSEKLENKEDKSKENNRTAIELRRKKSLSTSNIPNTQFLTVERLAVDNQTTSSLKRISRTPEAHPSHNGSKNALNLKRCHSVYDGSPKIPETDQDNSPGRKNKMAWSVRIKRNTMDWASNCSISKIENEMQKGRTRFGTIARKVQERKSNEIQNDKKRQRKRRIMRKKHARERQLVYSSFTICIAFALCIMPTAILYLVQVLSGKQAPASANLIVGCIAWIHAVVNPMIYGYLNSQYRKEYSKIAQSISNKLTCRGSYTAGRYR